MSTTSLAAAIAPPRIRFRFPSFWRSLDDDEALFLSSQIVLIELFLVVALAFGYAGVIVFAECMAAIILFGIVAITSTGLIRRFR